jgi:hypothetical protein
MRCDSCRCIYREPPQPPSPYPHLLCSFPPHAIPSQFFLVEFSLSNGATQHHAGRSPVIVRWGAPGEPSRHEVVVGGAPRGDGGMRALASSGRWRPALIRERAAKRLRSTPLQANSSTTVVVAARGEPPPLALGRISQEQQPPGGQGWWCSIQMQQQW